MGFDNVNVNVSGPVQPTSTYKTKVLKGNHSFASQVTEPNMKYVIKHDFVLDGDVTIPENCVLEFDGGSLRGKTIIGNHTIIIAGDYQIFCVGVAKYKGYTRYFSDERSIYTWPYAYECKIYGDDIEIAGTWDNVIVNPCWLGLNNVSPTQDSHLKIQRYLNLHKSGINVSIPRNTYYCYGSIDIFHPVDFNGSIIKCCKYSNIYDSSIVLPSNALALPEDDIYGLEMVNGLIRLKDSSIKSFCKNLTIDGNRDVNSEAIKFGMASLLELYSTLNNYLIENVSLKDSPACGMLDGGSPSTTYTMTFKNFNISNITEHGIYSHHYNGELRFENCSFYNCGDNPDMDFRGGAFIIKNTNSENASTDDLLFYFDNCRFEHSAENVYKHFMQIEGGNIEIHNSYLDSRMLSPAFGKQGRILNVKLVNTKNSFGYLTPYINTIVEYHNCRGNLTIFNSVKKIKECDARFIYVGDIECNYDDEYAEYRTSPVEIEDSKILYETKAMYPSTRNINTLNFTNTSIFVKGIGLSVEHTVFTTNVNFMFCDISVLDNNKNTILFTSATSDISIKHTKISGSGSYLIYNAANIVIDDIMIINCTLYNSGKTLSVTDNTERDARHYSGSPEQYKVTGYNNFGVLINMKANFSALSSLAKYRVPGSQVFIENHNRIAFLKEFVNNEPVFVGPEGYTYANSHGLLQYRPTNLKGTDIGFCYYLTDKYVPVYWNGSIWLYHDGFVAISSNGVLKERKGLFADKPALSSNDAGFPYFCTDRKYYIYYGGDGKWYDAMGREVTA